MAFARCTIISTYFGQEFQTVLWYRSQPDNPLGVDWVAGAGAISDWVADNVIRPAIGQMRMSNLVGWGTVFDRIETMIYNPPPIGSANMVELINAPFVYRVNEAAPQSNQDAFSPAAAAVLRLNCAATTLNPLDYTPRGGYILVGPIAEVNVLPNGDVRPEHLQSLSNFGAALIAQGTFGAGIGAIPVRVGVSRAGRPLPQFGWATVTSVTPRTQATWRRSRVPR